MEQAVLNLFALVREAMARATWALLNGDMELAQSVVDGDQEVDDMTAELELVVWSRIEADDLDLVQLRQLVGSSSSSPSSSAAPTSPSTSPRGLSRTPAPT